MSDHDDVTYTVPYSHHSIKRTGSIKRPGLEFFKNSLLSVPYDRKNEGLNILSYRSYNRVMRASVQESLSTYSMNES